MTARAGRRLFTIPPGVTFLPVLVEALLSGRLVPGLHHDGDPLALADVTIYVPTRRAARELRATFVERGGGRSAILPVIRPLGEFEEDFAMFAGGAPALELAPPVAELDRLLTLAPLVQAWKRRLPAHVAAKFAEAVVVPASAADALWLARDLAALMDDVETEGSDWSRLRDLVAGELGGWWQVTLEFLDIVTRQWPRHLVEIDRSNPAAHRNAMIDAEAVRLTEGRSSGPVIAAGSTGSVPATARLLAAISALPQGAVVLPGLDLALDDASWRALGAIDPAPPVYGHPQFGLAKLLRGIGVARDEVEPLALSEAALTARERLVGEALRPAETTDAWASERLVAQGLCRSGALDHVSLVEAANEHDEALAIAVALRRAVGGGERRAALVTTDRELARRVAAELRRFGIRADDSGGTPLARTPPAILMKALCEAVFRPGDPVALLSLLKHPLLRVGMARSAVRSACATIELAALRGGTGRPDIARLAEDFERRLAEHRLAGHQPFWLPRLGKDDIEAARRLLAVMAEAIAPLVAMRGCDPADLAETARAAVLSFEALGRDEAGSLAELYAGDNGEVFAAFLRPLVEAESRLEFAASEWPDMLAALIAPVTVKPSVDADSRVAIWGALEARLQRVDTVVLGGLNEGSWPRRAAPDRFMSRIMKSGLELEPPERRIGQAAHDFTIAMGTPEVVLARSARAGDAPAVESRWLQRLRTFAGEEATAAMRARGEALLGVARTLDIGPDVVGAARPEPKPPFEARPRRFSVTEIETLRRDPYAVYARRVLALHPLDPLIRDPGAAERGTLFHAILHRFTVASSDVLAADAEAGLLEIGRAEFRAAALPADVEAVWWPRFAAMAPHLIEWERGRAVGIADRHPEASAAALDIGATGVTLSGRADRIDVHKAGMADILDYKTGYSPSKAQAHALLAPQLALEGALLMRGAFAGIGARTPSELAYVRLKANGEVEEESILEVKGRNANVRTAQQLADDAWRRLGELILHYKDPATGYLSRALPFREGEVGGDYDHLARVLEWSAGGDAGPSEDAGE